MRLERGRKGRGDWREEMRRWERGEEKQIDERAVLRSIEIDP